MEKEMDLSAVIERIKQDGVGRGEKQAEEIIANAEKRAEEIIKEAEEKKAGLLAQAQDEKEKMKANGEAALNQAARDVIVSLASRLEELCNSLIKNEVSKELAPDNLQEIIKTLVVKCFDTNTADVEIVLGEKDKKELGSTLSQLLKKELEKEPEIKVSPSLKKGFRIGQKGGNLYYDFSSEAIAEAFNFYLNKNMRKIIKI